MAGRTFHGQAERDGNGLYAAFESGPIAVHAAFDLDMAPILSALGLASEAAAADSWVASPGRPRLLVPVADRAELASLAPDFDALRRACDLAGLLGCYVYTAPAVGDRVAARMFAPSIGVPEDIANVNSTAALGARLFTQGIDRITVDMGDSLDSPSTIVATTRRGPSGPLVSVGGSAAIMRTVEMARSHVEGLQGAA